MKNRLFVGTFLVALIAGCWALSVYAAPQDGQRVQSDRLTSTSWQYAMLAVDGELASFQAGENNLELEVLGVEDLYRRLGGTFRPNLTNLLNLIGRQGWELVVIEEGVYTFKRELRNQR